MRDPKLAPSNPATSTLGSAPPDSPVAMGLIDAGQLRTAVKQMAVSLPALMPGYSQGGTRGGLVIAKAKHLAREGGWKLLDSKNRERLVSGDGTKLIVFSTGNDRTGREGANVRHAKPWISEMVELPLFKSLIDRDPLAEVWILLYHRDAAAKVIRYELSRPEVMDEGRVITWGARHHFEPIITGKSKASAPKQKRNRPKQEAEPAPSVDVPTPRKR